MTDAMAQDPTKPVLPAVTALRDQDAGGQAPIERSLSADMRREREELKAAAEQSLNVILDLGLDGIIRWVSDSWKDIVGTTPESVKGKPLSDFLLSSKDGFANAIESMKKDDSKSRIVHFRVAVGPLSVLKEQRGATGETNGEESSSENNTEQAENEEQVLNLEGQGVIVYDRTSGEDSHTMWMLRPSTPPREVTIDLPELLVQSLGVGAEMLAHYLTELAESGANDPAHHPPPPPVMCRICERHITPWWFEKHTEGCTQETRAETEISLAQDNLSEHRSAIVKVLEALDPEARQSRPMSGEIVTHSTPVAEYKGLPINPKWHSPPSTDSSRTSPAGTPQRSRDSSLSRPTHSRPKSFIVRRPLSRIVTLLLDLCDTAMDINMPAIKPYQDGGEDGFRSQSPQSESRISQVRNWQTPSVTNPDQEQGLSALIADSEHLAAAKVDAVLRHREIIEYTERIRVEFHSLVLDCIDAAIKKASSIKAGNISDSSSEDEDAQDESQASGTEDEPRVGPYDGSPSMAAAFSDMSMQSRQSDSDTRKLSITGSTRSSSPGECPTPRSHRNTLSMLNQSESISQRNSLVIGSDAGESDTNMSQSMIVGHRRRESPSSDLALARSASSGGRKRRSLRLPNLPSPGRQPSPGRVPRGPASPLRVPKPRIPPGLEHMPSLPSPVTSPPLSGTEHSSPNPPLQRHRRQSSAASSIADSTRPPPSPRLNAINPPPPRAAPTSIKDFEIIKPISKGAFGSVYLSKKRSTGDYYAIKVLRKGDMVAKNQVTNVKAERAIMMWQGESEFVAKLYYTFASKDYLFLVMEYLNGGDCASLVKVLGGLPEDWAKKYLAEIVLGVQHLHSRGIVHRDLKPDNFLIDQKGHLKLTDFGLSRMGLVGRQKRALRSPNDSHPDLLKSGGPFTRAASIGSSRSASFDLQGKQSPQSTPVMTPDLAGGIGQPSYFSLNRDSILGRDHARRKSGYRSDSGTSESFHAMFRSFSLNDDDSQPRGAPIEEEGSVEGSPVLYALRPTTSNASTATGHPDTPPQQAMPPPPLALFDPDDQNRRFVGTPDYLAPETINGLGQDESSDWWSLGCILFEFLFGYPPFHGDTPEKVFENILERKIDWPDDSYCAISAEAKDLMEKLMTIDPKQRLGSNIEEKFMSGGDEIRAHSWFDGINWDTLVEDQASFIPAPENPEDTEYFDARGATLQTFTEEMEDQSSSSILTPGGSEYTERPHDALSRVRNQVNSMKRNLLPLHIPAHVRESRNRRLSEPVANDDFGSFTYKNLSVLEKANKDLLEKLKTDAANKQTQKAAVPSQPSSAVPTTPSLDGSPLLPMPLKRTLSTNKGPNRPASPSSLSQANPSPSRPSQPSSPLVSFSTGQNHERRKTSSTSSSYSIGNSLQPGGFIDSKGSIGNPPTSATSIASSPVKSARHSMNLSVASPERPVGSSRPHSIHLPSSRNRSQTVGSQEGENISALPSAHYKRHSQVFDMSPSSSDNEDPRAKALLRVQRRRQSSKSFSHLMHQETPSFRPLDILICEDHPVSRLVMERLVEKLKCRSVTVTNGAEAARIAMSQIQFDLIMMEYKLPQINGADVAHMIRDTKSANTQTPLVAVTGYLKELPQTHHFDSLIEKPLTIENLTETLLNHCHWKPAPPGYAANSKPPTYQNLPSCLRQESRQAEDSPSSQSSGPFARLPNLYKSSSREHSIGSSFFGDTESTNTEDIPVIIGRPSDDWPPSTGLGITGDVSISAFPSINDQSFIHPGLPHLLHHNSAPSGSSTEFRSPRKQPSAEVVKARREDMLKNQPQSAESGDDEDEELGNKQARARSPQVKQKSRSSKLGIEMMRTNSRGSVTSTISDEAPHMMGDVTSAVPVETGAQAVLGPPERFPSDSKGDAMEVVDMDATPRPSTSTALSAIEQAGTTSPSPVKQ